MARFFFVAFAGDVLSSRFVLATSSRRGFCWRGLVIEVSGGEVFFVVFAFNVLSSMLLLARFCRRGFC